MAENGGVRGKIAIGCRVGHLTVEAETPARKGGYVVWKCRCDCGGVRELDTRCLHRGRVTDCGCLSKVDPGQRDLTGRRFGRLVCLAPTDSRSQKGDVIWSCRCDCGSLCDVAGTRLTGGEKKSCGCAGHPARKELEGRRFGKLTVIAYAGKRAGMHRWRCRCDCGGETEVGQTLLQSGKTKSCGCLQTQVLREKLKLCDGTSVTCLEARRKTRLSSNTSGHTGIYQNKRSGKWIAQITFKRRTYYLGSYDRIEDAIQARKQGEKMHEAFLEWYYAEHGKA